MITTPATSRVLVQNTIAEKFLAGIKAAFADAEATLGSNPLDPKTMYGPIVDKQQFDKIMSYIEIGKKTATLLTGGSQKGDKGYFIKPTIFVNPDPESPVVKEEIFGPVMVIQTFGSEEEALRLANGSVYGLAGWFLSSCFFLLFLYSNKRLASVYTSNLDRALRVSSQLECGGVAVNSPFLPQVETPFGGIKASGQGRELGKYGLLEYTEPKSIHIKYDFRPFLCLIWWCDANRSVGLMCRSCEDKA